MALVLVGPDERIGETLVARLVAAGDQVRVIEPSAQRAGRWKALGAYVAVGDAADEDFVGRAAGGARTVVLFGSSAAAEVLAGAALAGVGRVVVYARRAGGAFKKIVAGCGLQYVMLIDSRRGFRKVPVDAVAAAIDAADDLAGAPRLHLDLSRPEAWTTLRLAAPGEGESRRG